MKPMTILAMILLFYACNPGTDNVATKIKDSTAVTVPAKDSTEPVTTSNTDRVADFRKLRDALYSKNKTTVKKYFRFPVLNNNNTWLFCMGDAAFEKRGFSYEQEKSVPFTEKDFDQYYSNLFPDKFTKAVNKINPDDLYHNNIYETAEMKDKTGGIFKIYATVDTIAMTLTLNLASRYIYKIEGNETEAGESSVIYEFTILPDGHLNFLRLDLAG